jgi:hypothetical protein
LLEAIERYGIGFVFLTDEAFGQDRVQAYEFATLMKKLDLLWGAGGVRCNSITRDDIKFYADNNCVALKFGVESGSQKMLDIMEKRFEFDVEQAIKWCAEFNCFLPWQCCWACGRHVVETSKFIAKLCYEIGKKPFEIFGDDISFAIPFPGTPLYEYGQQLGLIGTTVDDEELFLEGLYTAPTMKMSYINLSGSNASDVLFWDVMLVFLVLKEYEMLISSSPVTAATTTTNIVGEKSNEQSATQAPVVGVRYDGIFTAIFRRIRRMDFSIPNRPPVTNLIMRTIVGRRRFNWFRNQFYFRFKIFLYIEYLFVSYMHYAGKRIITSTCLPSCQMKKIQRQRFLTKKSYPCEISLWQTGNIQRILPSKTGLSCLMACDFFAAANSILRMHPQW